MTKWIPGRFHFCIDVRDSIFCGAPLNFFANCREIANKVLTMHKCQNPNVTNRWGEAYRRARPHG
jgi:hypothetical protein